MASMSGSPDGMAAAAEGWGLLAVEVEDAQPAKLNAVRMSTVVTKWCSADSLMGCEVPNDSDQAMATGVRR